MTGNRFTASLTTLLGCCVASGAALAADAQSAIGTDTLEEVVVTGSRLQASGFNAPTPVTVVTTEVIEQRAPANLSDVLLEQPALRFNAADASRQGSGGSGNPLPQGQIVAPDLRSLGANRTLVLLDSHRLVSSTWDSQVDLNIIPVGLVERIDVVTGGASAAYGADAVAGVTNIILRKKMEGIKVGAQMGVTEHSTAKQYTVNLSGGTNLMGGRLHVIGGVDANRTEAIRDVYGTRFGQSEIGNFAGANNSLTSYRVLNNAPATVITTNVEPASVAPGGLYIAPNGQAYTFNSSGDPVSFTRGTLTNNSQLMIGSTANYGHNLNNQVTLRTPNARYDFMGRASFDISDRMNTYFEFNNSRNLAFPFVGAEFQQSAALGGNTPGIVVSRTSPFVSAATAALLTSAGQAGTTFTIGRNDTELTFGGLNGNAARQDAETRRFAIGLEGSLGETWKYDAYFQQGRAWTLLERNDFSPWAMQKAVNGCATPVVGSPGFTSAAQVNALNLYESLSGKTCVPFNPFGVGRNSAAAIDYVQNQSYTDQHMSQDAASVGVTGRPLRLPAGDLGVAFGLDWRQERINAPVDAVSRAGSGFNAPTVAPLSNTVAEVFGHYHVHEGYLELGVPLLKDKFLAKSLDLNAAGRITRYELAGTVRTWKLGATWQPIEPVRLRLTKSHDIRQANMVEMYRNGGPNNGNVDTTHLLVGTVGANGTVYNPPGNTAAVGSVSNVANISIGTLNVGGVGNPSLRPEVADTVTGGVVFTRGGFNASTDYYYINITDVIAGPGSQFGIDNCVAGDQKYCNYITFGNTQPSGLALIGVPSQNLNRQVVKGLDFELAYGHQVGAGRLSVRSLVNFQPHNEQVNFLTGQTTDNANTLGSQPRVSYNLNFRYDVGRWNSSLQVRGFGARRGNGITYDARGNITANTTLGPEDGADYAARVAAATAVVVGGVTVAQAGTVAASTSTTSKNRWPAANFVNGQVSFAATSKVQVYFNVDNLLNKQPPELSTSASVYDFVGRRYRFGARANF